MRDLFPGYYKSELDERQLFSEGIFVFDTNVLFNLYRYSAGTREQLFMAIEAVRERIWLPYRVAHEFQLRRLDIIRNERKAYDDAINYFESIESNFQKLIVTQKKDTTAQIALEKAWSLCTLDSQRAIEYLKQCVQETPLVSLDDTLRERIDQLFNGRVGQKPEPEKANAHKQEAQKRIDEEIPPGYKDAKNKDEDRAQGDCLIWLQTLDYIQTQKKPLIFVSDDVKDDWYWRVHGKTIGPRRELVEEVRARANVDLILSNSANFIEKISRLFLTSEAQQNWEGAVAEAKQVQKDNMVHQAVSSSNIKSVAYDADSAMLQIRFRNDRLYEYSEVPENVWQELMNAPAQGKYFVEKIRNFYDARMLDNGEKGAGYHD